MLCKGFSVTKWLFMEAKLSVFELHWVGVIVLSCPPREQPVQDFSTRYGNFDNVFIICVEKFINQLETKMTDVDSGIVG